MIRCFSTLRRPSDSSVFNARLSTSRTGTQAHRHLVKSRPLAARDDQADRHSARHSATRCVPACASTLRSERSSTRLT